MGKVAVKICGLQSVEVLKSMINLPVDYVGFVFTRSKRQISGSQAAGLLPILKEWTNVKPPQSVGVFVNPSIQELRDVLLRAPLDVLQLHGTESPEFCREAKANFGLKVFKALSVKKDGSLHGELSLERYDGLLDGLLLDTYDPEYGGGSGVAFDWAAAAPYQNWAKQQGIPLIAAGGLHPGNVQEMIRTLGPDGVDVSSGVETDGVKDIAKVAAFVERVKEI